MHHFRAWYMVKGSGQTLPLGHARMAGACFKNRVWVHLKIASSPVHQPQQLVQAICLKLDLSMSCK